MWEVEIKLLKVVGPCFHSKILISKLLLTPIRPSIMVLLKWLEDSSKWISIESPLYIEPTAFLMMSLTYSQ